jgi:hypothetical protein
MRVRQSRGRRLLSSESALPLAQPWPHPIGHVDPAASPPWLGFTKRSSRSLRPTRGQCRHGHATTNMGAAPIHLWDTIPSRTLTVGSLWSFRAICGAI